MKRFIGIATSAASMLAILAASSAWAQQTSSVPPTVSAISKIQRVSTSSTGKQGESASWAPKFAPNGVNVAFSSQASSLMPGNAGKNQLYLKNIVTNRIRRISETSAGVAGDCHSYPAVSFSPDGSKVVFSSLATNFTPAGNPSGNLQIFEKNLTTGAIRQLCTDATGKPANGRCAYPTYSPDGKSIAFSSNATNLVVGDNNGHYDIFLKDLASGAVRRLSMTWTNSAANGDSYNPVFSRNGARIAFVSRATNLVKGGSDAVYNTFYRSIATNDIKQANVTTTGTTDYGSTDIPVFSPNNARILFVSNGTLVPSDKNSATDIYAKTITNGNMVRVSLTDIGGELNGNSINPTFSKNGLFFAYSTSASNLATNDKNNLFDVYVQNIGLKKTVRASTKLTGADANGMSYEPSLSPDGSKVAFTSYASDLVGGDTNGQRDVFVATLK